MDDVTKAFIMDFGHFDPSDDGPVVEVLYQSADGMLNDAGITEDVADHPRRLHCIAVLVAFWFDNRSTAGDAAQLPGYLSRMVRGLEDACDVRRAALAMEETDYGS